ncbi:matrixin family metalloprotease [bacterium]|nr:matrixin family metalloprotease [bacterium]
MRRAVPYILSFALCVGVLLAGRLSAPQPPDSKPIHSPSASQFLDMSPGAVCFAPGTPDEYMAEWEARIFGDRALDFRIGDRWQYTATNGYTGSPGSPITLTYSFIPDGVTIDGSPSQLFSRLNSLFGNPQAWQQQFALVFERWSEVSGITYVHVTDDGANFGAAGSLGSRGDVRIGSISIDGPSNVLAYNFYPDQGDMVLDASENWGAQAGNYIFLRNIAAHEHGHGWGLAHVCPANSTKLLEPFYSSAFDGPQHDDIRAAVRNYGDRFEPNNDAFNATELGIFQRDTTITEIGLNSVVDQDWWYFEIPNGFGFNLTVQPIGRTYLEGAQNGDGSCQAGTLINTLDDLNLDVFLYDATGSTVLAQSNTRPAGQSEQIYRFDTPPGGGAYQANVIGSQADNVQLYDLVFDLYNLSDPYLTVPALNFDTTQVGTPVILTTLLVNNVHYPLIVSSISTTGMFTVTPQDSLTLPASGSRELSVTYLATSLGSHTGMLTIHHNGPSGVIQCPLSGTAVDSWLQFVISNTVEFGEVMVGHMDSIRTAIRAMGNVPMTVQSIEVAPPFSALLNLPMELQVTQTLFFWPRFAPTEVGEYNGLLIINHSGTSSPDTIFLHGFGVPLAADDFAATLPGEFRLHQNYPNPFNPTTRIAFDLPRASDVKLEVFNVQGCHVREFLTGNLAAGNHTVEFDGSGLPSGVYLYRLSAGGFEGFGKMMLLK